MKLNAPKACVILLKSQPLWHPGTGRSGLEICGAAGWLQKPSEGLFPRDDGWAKSNAGLAEMRHR